MAISYSPNIFNQFLVLPELLSQTSEGKNTDHLGMSLSACSAESRLLYTMDPDKPTKTLASRTTELSDTSPLQLQQEVTAKKPLPDSMQTSLQPRKTIAKKDENDSLPVENERLQQETSNNSSISPGQLNFISVCIKNLENTDFESVFKVLNFLQEEYLSQLDGNPKPTDSQAVTAAINKLSTVIEYNGGEKESNAEKHKELQCLHDSFATDGKAFFDAISKNDRPALILTYLGDNSLQSFIEEAENLWSDTILAAPAKSLNTQQVLCLLIAEERKPGGNEIVHNLLSSIEQGHYASGISGVEEAQIRIDSGDNGFGKSLKYLTGILQKTLVASTLVELFQSIPTAGAQQDGGTAFNCSLVEHCDVGLLGPKGDNGMPGASGVAGAMGPKGDSGIQGAMGPKGDSGIQGAMGAKGAVGAMGPKGAVGAVGPRGGNGTTGAPGLPGSMGYNGTTGASGPRGPRGYKGQIGALGPRGPRGYNGSTGAPGPRGLCSDAGTFGYGMLGGATTVFLAGAIYASYKVFQAFRETKNEDQTAMEHAHAIISNLRQQPDNSKSNNVELPLGEAQPLKSREGNI